MDKKENKFSWKKKDEKENDAKSTSEKNDIKGEDDFMQFSNGASVLDESKKAGHESATQIEDTSKPASASFLPRKEESYISKDVIINGSITAISSIVIDGKVNGDVTTDNDITVCGSIEGNVSANSIKFSGAIIKGDINCKGNISFVKGSDVEGNVSGKSLEINGTIHGNIKAEQSAVIMGNALINGDILAGLISVMEGAVIKGNVHVTKSESPSAAIAQVVVASADDKVAAAVASAKAGGNDILKRFI
jgi:cytoskeletal protein CcmA (bactofilin family)